MGNGGSKFLQAASDRAQRAANVASAEEVLARHGKTVDSPTVSKAYWYFPFIEQSDPVVEGFARIMSYPRVIGSGAGVDIDPRRLRRVQENRFMVRARVLFLPRKF